MSTNGYDIDSFRIGPMDNFGYLLIDRATATAASIDPAWDAGVIRERAERLGVRIEQVLLTHSHHDHVNALDGFAGLPVHISRAEADAWPDVPDGAIHHEDGDETRIGDTVLTWRVTPGHSPGSACLVLANDAFTADTLFVYGCGRCDLDGSDPHAMFASLTRLKTLLDPSLTIHPGHDYGVSPTSTMREQLAGNPFLMFDDGEAFTRYRLHDHGTLRSQPFGPERAPYPD